MVERSKDMDLELGYKVSINVMSEGPGAGKVSNIIRAF